jgi:DNA-binding transcriptional regulator/RsmH inhibitor MraZ
MLYFVSAFPHVIDNKGRLAIPSSHRQIMPESPSGKKRFCARPIEKTEPNGVKLRFIELIPEPTFIALADKEKTEDRLELSTEELDRQMSLFAGVRILEVDEQGRVAMPDEFLDRPERDAKSAPFAVNILGRNVVVAGMGLRIHVWNAEEYYRRYDGTGKIRAA